MYTTTPLTVLGSVTDTLVFEPDGRGASPGIVVAQHLPVAHEGLERDPFTLDVGERLAAAGYVAVIPFMFHWWPTDADIATKRDAWRDDHAIADLDAAFTLLANMARVDPERIGIVGHCWGGRMAWLGACTNARLAAAAMFYGGRIATAMGPQTPPPIDLAGRIACPVLGIFGNEDQNPSPDDVANLDRVLSEHGIEHEFHQYDDAGHGFQDFVNEQRYRPSQSGDAWTKLFAFLDRTLG